MDMGESSKHLLRIEAIFAEVLAAPEQARPATIERLCQGNRELADEVRSLLEASEAEERLTASCRSDTGSTAEPQVESRQIGPYLLDRLLGRGGMGAVYLAHRADGQFDQQVAIKLIDMPMATDLFRNRFRQERQILAGLQHPYIARLLDGGVSSSGELYLAMEYVNGVPIHCYCDNHGLDVPRRIALFLLVCEAVQFAHQNFVVHRDLKPDNILVAEDGTPRLLDFGTAKLLSPADVAPAGELTREGFISYTPQYASPEQVLGKPVTAASDTYSLGVLLYFLLTGDRPYDLKDLATVEMMQAICEQAPRKPSAANGSGMRIDADLEAILLKALRKEPEMRYLTVERFADDLRAYTAGRPVTARQGSARYLAAKFIRRHRWGLAATAVLLITMMSGITGILWQSRIANRERLMAEARSSDLRQLSNSLLTELDEAIQQIPGSTNAQELLVKSVLKHLDRMAADAHGDRQTQLDLAAAYTQLGNLQGSPYMQNLGDAEGGQVSIRKAIALAEPFTRPGSKDREAIYVLAKAQHSLGTILFLSAPISDAIAATREAIAGYDRMAAIAPPSKDELFDYAISYDILGDELGLIQTDSLNDLSGALNAYRKYIDLTNRALAMDPSLKWARDGLISEQSRIAEVEMDADPQQALQDVRLGLQLIANLPLDDRKSLSIRRTYNGLMLDQATDLVELGRYREANALLAENQQEKQRLVAADPKDFRALTDLVVSYIQASRNYLTESDPALAPSPADQNKSLVDAEHSFAREIEALNKLLKLHGGAENWKPFLADAQVNLGSIQSLLHQEDRSQELVRSGLATFKELATRNQVSSDVLDGAAMDFLYAEPSSLKEPQFAVSCAERAVTLTRRLMPSKLLTLSQAYRAAGQVEKSRATAREALALLPAPKLGATKPRIRKLLEIQAQATN